VILAVVVFLVAAGADVLWAKYTMHAADRNAGRAALWGALIIPAGAVSIIAYTDNHWYLIPAALGAYAGTYVAVSRHKEPIDEWSDAVGR